MAAEADDDPLHERRAGPTPAGGAYAVIWYRDAAGNRARKSAAVEAEVTEYAADGAVVARAYAAIEPKPEPPPGTVY